MSADDGDATPSPPGHDLRMPLVALGAWAGGLAAHGGGPGRGAALAVAAVAVGAGWWARRRGLPVAWLRALGAAALVGAAVLGAAELREAAVDANPVRAVASDRATVDVAGLVASDPREVRGRFATQVVVRIRVQELASRGWHREAGGTLVVLGDPAWAGVRLGERVAFTARLAPAHDAGVVALAVGARPPVRIRGPDPWWRASAAVRASIRDAVAHRPPAQAGLVPALVDGDDAALPSGVVDDFRTVGLTHLTAVSGTNLTLVVGALLLLARVLGVRRRWLTVVGLAGIAGFVLLARTEPSVLRAAAMGTVGLVAFRADGRRRGLRALGVAVTALLLVQPALAVSPGFALSVLATAGIVVLAPPLAASLSHWLPGWLALAIAVPSAAQLACTPVVAVLSGEVSLVAVAANVVAAPAVGPATVLGLLAGLVGLVAPAPGRLLGTGAGWCVGWIVLVAERGADLPGAAVGWGTGTFSIVALSVLCLVAAAVLPALAARPRIVVPVLAVLLVVAALPGLPGGGPRWPWSGAWPPPGWVLVACDVGQGDALVVRTGEGSAVVVDAGPDPAAVDRCLDDAGVRVVDLVVLTHFHADHVDGLPGVVRGRRVRAVETTAVLDPPGGVAAVAEALAGTGVVPVVAPFGTTRRIGGATLQVVHPDVPGPTPGAGDGTSANDASVVLLVEVAGVRLLLTGDVEPAGQARLAHLVGDLDVDVLKVPHHGSRHQDVDWLTGLRPEVAVVSVGADNDYGHPDPGLLERLRAAGATVARTDRDGDLAVVVGRSGPEVRAGG